MAAKKGAKKTTAKTAKKGKATTSKKATTKKAGMKMKATGKAATRKTAAKSTAKTTARTASRTTKKAAGPKKKRTLNPALRAPYTPSTFLAAIVGTTPLPRQEVVSKLWKYIKKNGLQDRQNINADDKLKPIFSNKKAVTMFEMQKHLSKHLTKV